MKVGGSTTLTLAMRTSAYSATPRAGANIAVDVLMDPSGIVTLEPARVVFNGPVSRGEVKVQATAPGSVLLRIAVPDGFSASTTPALVGVVP
ncbi:MAG: hypothetical protein IPP47_33085 [Bryobacterales bacterium]|nr:hypothetical protein [Bryobacterales bacterium]